MKILDFFFYIVTTLTSIFVQAQPVSKSHITNTAIGSKDSVMYYTQDVKKSRKAVIGKKQYEVKHLGVNWRFATKSNADKFAANPSAYLPMYNGHCANGLSLGEGLISTDGAFWGFFGGQLYLFYSEKGYQRWLNNDWQSYKKDADAAWADLSK